MAELSSKQVMVPFGLEDVQKQCIIMCVILYFCDALENHSNGNGCSDVS